MNMIVDSKKLKSMNKQVKKVGKEVELIKKGVKTTSRFVYCILHGFLVEDIVRADYIDLVEYTGMALKTITISIRELIEGKYIERIGRGKYKIL